MDSRVEHAVGICNGLPEFRCLSDLQFHKPLRILHMFGCMNRGGAEMRTLELFRHLAPLGYEFEFCSLSGMGGELDDDIRQLGGMVHLLKLDITFPWRFHRLLQTRSYLAVHSHVHYFSGFLLRLAAKGGVPMRIAHFRSTGDGKGTGIYRSARNAMLQKWIREYATWVLGVSEAALDASFGGNWRSDPKCRVIYSGIDLCDESAKRDTAGVRQEFGIPADAVILIHIGRMTTEKNHVRLTQMFSAFAKKMPHSYLLLVGSKQEPVYSAVRRLVSDHGFEGRVILCGVRTDIRRLLLASNLMICPSVREGMPGAVLEACAMGTPVLASDIAPVIELSKYLPVKTMSLQESNEKWVAASLELCNNKKLQSRLRSHFEASPFTMSASVAAFRSVYESSQGLAASHE